MLIDFHSHILPGLDHGCADLPQSLQQLLAAKKAGVDIIAATSHFYPHRDTVNSFLHRRELAWQELQDRLPEDGPRIFVGAEVLVCEGMDRMEGLEKLTFGDGVLLLEMPMGGWNRTLCGTVEAIAARYPNLILAHVDRYPTEDMERFLRAGIMGQLNASSICRFFGRKQLLKWVEAGYIYAVGSDTHGVGRSFELLKKATAILGAENGCIQERALELLEPKVSNIIRDIPNIMHNDK